MLKQVRVGEEEEKRKNKEKEILRGKGDREGRQEEGDKPRYWSSFPN